jgi:hypothetical protein
MIKRVATSFLALLFVSAAVHFALTDEGQWTPDQIAQLNLRRAGLRIPVDQVFNPGGAGIHEAVILLGGGTAEFVSAEGLIMTNHHVAFGAVARIATEERDYITDGYYARTPEEEIPARGYSARMVQVYEDVTDRILASVTPRMSYDEREQAIREATARLVEEARGDYPGIQLSVSTLSYGNAFKLIGFQMIRDIRIVYVPPFAVGNFGADTDNWMFPRHTGDFSFLRAYVAPDGSPAAYSEQNVPYRPRSWLKTAARGPEEGDFAFLLGFPGTTMRYRDSYFVEYEQNSRLPYEIMIRGERIDVMTRAGEGDRALQIRFAETIKGIANGYKNYQGKVVGFDRQGLVATKRAEEAGWVRWYSSRAELNRRYDGVLESLERVYAEIEAESDRDRIVNELLYSGVQSYARDLYDYLVQMQLPEGQRSERYRGDRAVSLMRSLLAGPGNAYLPVDEELYRRAAIRSLDLPADRAVGPFQAMTRGQELYGYAPVVAQAVSEAYATSPILRPDGRERMITMAPEEAVRFGGLFMQVAVDLSRIGATNRIRQAQRNRGLTRLRQLYAEGIMAFREEQGETLYPDANRSLRFSYGYVKGYDPKDAVHIKPFTHLTGVMEKETGEGDFIVPDQLREAWRQKDFGPFADDTGDVPVNLLSTCDTTGGNSGSPVMNARGELIGINFDRVWEATVNDYNFDPDFGRNISVDMRYILFCCRVFGATRVVRELGY